MQINYEGGKKGQPETLKAATYFKLSEKYFRDGSTYPAGSVFLMPAGERPARGWRECDKEGNVLGSKDEKAPAPVYPAKAQPHLDAGREDKRDGKAPMKGRASDSHPL